MITISIVSHGQGSLVLALLRDIASFPNFDYLRVIISINTPEELPFSASDFLFPVQLLESPYPRGFSENHNAAFRESKSEWFCVLNPDVRLTKNPFQALIAAAESAGASVIAPSVVSPDGSLEDSTRHFPTIGSMLKKMFLGKRDSYVFSATDQPFSPDWVGGMFMLFESKAFSAVGGFDESFFLYYEDVDICVRLWNRGLKVLACPAVQIVHDARRSSHRSLKYLKWHITSLLRYLYKHSGRLPKIPETDVRASS